MAQTLSTMVTNMVSADPRNLSNANISGATPKIMRDTVTVPDTADNDTIILAPLPVDAIIASLEVTAADLGSAGTVDIGLYTPTSSGTFVAVDVDAIASGLVMSTAVSNALAPQRFNGLAADSISKKLWEIAGLTARPSYAIMYIGLKTTTGTTASGTVSVVCHYTI